MANYYCVQWVVPFSVDHLPHHRAIRTLGEKLQQHPIKSRCMYSKDKIYYKIHFSSLDYDGKYKTNLNKFCAELEKHGVSYTITAVCPPVKN